MPQPGKGIQRVRQAPRIEPGYSQLSHDRLELARDPDLLPPQRGALFAAAGQVPTEARQLCERRAAVQGVEVRAALPHEGPQLLPGGAARDVCSQQLCVVPRLQGGGARPRLSLL